MVHLVALLAEIPDNPSTLITYGPLGIITAWLMWRDEKRAIQMREAEIKMQAQLADMLHRFDGLTKALLLEKHSPKSRPEQPNAIPEIYARLRHAENHSCVQHPKHPMKDMNEKILDAARKAQQAGATVVITGGQRAGKTIAQQAFENWQATFAEELRTEAHQPTRRPRVCPHE